MDLNIVEIAAAGAMGVNVLGVVAVVLLLRREQAQDDPRPIILRSIYVFMGFAAFMTAGAIIIEQSRQNKPSVNDELAAKLEEIRGDSLYSTDRYGNPAEIKVDLNGEPFVLSAAFPNSFFADAQLNLVKEAGRYLAVKNSGSTKITYGHFPKEEIEGKVKLFFSGLLAPADEDPSPALPTEGDVSEILYAAGFAFTPGTVRNDAKVVLNSSESKANKRLIEFLSTDGLEDDATREKAVKMLLQPKMMNKLDVEGHDRLIELLSTNGVRITPWRYYEAAQVYLSRYQLMGEVTKADIDKHQELSRDYLRAFKSKGWTSVDHPNEYSYYLSAAKAVGYEIDESTGLVKESVRLK